MGRLSTPGLILGIGIGGAFDGIVFHQLLQWHHMVMIGGPSTWMLADGIFHTFSVGSLLIGTYLLWQQGAIRSMATDRALWGSILVGAGLFNLVEGVVDHHILQVHHVRPGPDQLTYDLLFLAAGALLVAWGWRLIQGTRPPIQHR